MKSFKAYVIGVTIAMVLALVIMWLKGGAELVRTGGIFFSGWIVGAISMYIRKEVVEKKWFGHR